MRSLKQEKMGTSARSIGTPLLALALFGRVHRGRIAASADVVKFRLWNVPSAVASLLYFRRLRSVLPMTAMCTASRIRQEIFQFIYFSLVTLASLGYGDIIPLSPPARAVAAVEGIAGQFYIAVLIARLVSLHSSRWGSD
jgi:hypothetical protein